MIASTRSFLFAGFAASQACAGWGVPPAGWEDFRIALVDDNTKTETIREALKAGSQIYGRYRYLNGGVDPKSNWYNFSGPDGATLTNFEKNSRSLGIRSSFVIYMLQEEGGSSGFKTNVNDPVFMKNFFWNLEWIAKAMTGQGAVYVLEPDTWGYLMQEEHKRGVTSPPEFGKATAKESARVNDLGYPWLSDLPNTVAGLVQGIIRTFRIHAPDAHIGLHANTWAWYPPTGGHIDGMVYWQQGPIDTYADITAAFFRNLFGAADPKGSGKPRDMGDFITVEKYGLDAGVGGPRYYWTDAHMAKWMGWSKRVGQMLDLPILGWQIPIGHLGLPNTENRYEDTFMAYFFSHPKEFLDAGFIGLWVGKGLANGTDFSVLPDQGDGGWLFQKMREFDVQRPYFVPTSVRNARGRFSRGIPRGPLIFSGRGAVKASFPAKDGLSTSWFSLRGRTLSANNTPLQGISEW